MNVIIIPSLNPDEKFISYVEDLSKNRFKNIVVIDDGSKAELKYIFERIAEIEGCEVLTHVVNMGKGRALKDSFNYVLQKYAGNSEFTGVITADSDGQHTVYDVKRVDETLTEETENAIILGSRNFHLKNIPFKSKFGNRLTSFLFHILYGVKLEDTQTGLRGIGKDLLPGYTVLAGERFEYEMNMLIDAAHSHVSMKEIEIETIYENNNSETHFDPVLDSFKIYKLIFGNFFRFIFASLGAAVVDLIGFQLFLLALKDVGGEYIIIYATVLARIISSLFNYSVNRHIVFKSKEKAKNTLIKYYILCLVQMSCSAVATYFAAKYILIPKVIIKCIVDTILFFISYRIQKNLVFKK